LGDFLGMGEDVAQVWFGVIGETTDTGWARGVLVTGLTAGSPAAAAGLRPAGGRTAGDVIVAIDDTPVYEMEHLRSVLKAQRPGSKPVLTILREGRLQQLTVALPSRERLLPVAETPDPWVSF
jgi:S1-C subfamily serine protease